MDDPILALAILSLGAFVGVVLTGLFYIGVFRPGGAGESALEPIPLQAGGGGTANDVRTELQQLRHLLERSATQPSNEELLRLVRSLNERIEQQSLRLDTLSKELYDSHATLGAIVDQLDTQTGILSHANAILEQIENTGMAVDSSAEITALRGQIAAQQASISKMLGDLQVANLGSAIREQTEKLGHLHARIDEQAGILAQALTQQREQQALLKDIDAQIEEVEEEVVRIKPSRQDRLTDIKGIGRVYAGLLYDAGIQTFKQLAAFSPEELRSIVKSKRANTDEWIEHAKQLVAQQEKLEVNR
jgi:predicted flap endonuclease-1-like 5' DNA nuclease